MEKVRPELGATFELHSLTKFCARATGLPRPVRNPQIRYVSHKKLDQLTGYRGVHAAYQAETRTIFLHKTWKNDIHGKHLLAHELVHHMQNMSGQELSEAQAYKAMFLYVAENSEQFAEEIA